MKGDVILERQSEKSKGANLSELENVILEGLRLLLEHEDVLQTAIEEYNEIDHSSEECLEVLWTYACTL